MADDSRVVAPVNYPFSMLGNIPRSGTIVTPVAVAAAASTGTVYTVARIPATARILPGSFVEFDELDAEESATIDVGFAPVGKNVSADDDALNAGIDVTSAGSAPLVADHADWGKKAWQYVAGVTEEPPGFLDVTVTIKDDPAATGGNMTVVVVYAVD